MTSSSTFTKQTTNGRIELKQTNTNDLFQMYDRIPVSDKIAPCSTYRNPMAGLWESTKVSDVFFSEENIDVIQNAIRNGVYERSKGRYTIGRQDCDVLKVIMRSVYLQFSRNQNDNISQQIEKLNSHVIGYAVPQVHSEAMGFNKYIYDISHMYKPMPPPTYIAKTDKELTLKPWF